MNIDKYLIKNSLKFIVGRKFHHKLSIFLLISTINNNNLTNSTWFFLNPHKNKKIFLKIFKKSIDFLPNMCYYIQVENLGVAQLGERYLGVVEAASSSLVT